MKSKDAILDLFNSRRKALATVPAGYRACTPREIGIFLSDEENARSVAYKPLATAEGIAAWEAQHAASVAKQAAIARVDSFIESKMLTGVSIWSASGNALRALIKAGTVIIPADFDKPTAAPAKPTTGAYSTTINAPATKESVSVSGVRLERPGHIKIGR